MAELMLRGLCKSYGGAPVVENLDLTIPAGAFVALLGPSGCGKTTILRMLAGFETPDAGEIRLGPRLLADPRRQVPPEQRGMGMVFQSYALWPHFTVADNVGYPLRLRGLRGADYQRRVHEALALVQLQDKAGQSPQNLSGGQRQRVALARCLVAEPQVVLLDEPLANLDRHLRASLEEHFRAFHQRTGATFIYVTHDQGEAMALADHVAVLNRGRLVQWAVPEELYQRPRTDWLAGFVGQGSVLQASGATPGEWLTGERLMAALAAPNVSAQPVLVRPEHVRCGEGGLPAQVSACVFKGERYELRLRLPCGQDLLGFHGHALACGERIGVRVEHGWCLERSA